MAASILEYHRERLENVLAEKSLQLEVVESDRNCQFVALSYQIRYVAGLHLQQSELSVVLAKCADNLRL